jgi:hypothetical protein
LHDIIDPAPDPDDSDIDSPIKAITANFHQRGSSMNKEQWSSLPLESQKMWDLLPDELKASSLPLPVLVVTNEIVLDLARRIIPILVGLTLTLLVIPNLQ